MRGGEGSRELGNGTFNEKRKQTGGVQNAPKKRKKKCQESSELDMWHAGRTQDSPFIYSVDLIEILMDLGQAC